MQQVTRKTLGAGINLTCVTTPKFKRAVLRAMLVLPLGGEGCRAARVSAAGFAPRHGQAERHAGVRHRA